MPRRTTLKHARAPSTSPHPRRRNRPRGDRRSGRDAARRGSAGEAELRVTEYPFGARHYLETGDILSDDDLAVAREARGDPARRGRRRPARPEARGRHHRARPAAEAALRLRPLRQPAADRAAPAAWSRPLSDPGDVDFVVVREGTEGPYVGNGGSIRVGTPHEIANEVSASTPPSACERVVQLRVRAGREAPQEADPRAQDQRADATPDRSGRAPCRPRRPIIPDVAWDYLHVDAATIFLVTDPARFDVIVTDNLFGDILTDLAGAISGGIGLAASGNINPDGTFPSMFEPVHGSAPGHRRAAEGRPHRGDPVHRAAARPPRACRMRRHGSTAAVTADLAARGSRTAIDRRDRRRDRRRSWTQ